MRRLVAVLALALAACAEPRTNPRGLATQAPTLTAESFEMADGAKLHCRRWSPEAGEPKAVILALHGFKILLLPKS